MSIAAGVSWLIAHDVIGHTNTYFAPVASTIVLGVVPGERSRRAVEMVLGIALGIGIAAGIIQLIGSGALQISLVVLLAVSAAILLGGGRLIASQAAGSAVLIAALPAAHAAPTRFVDALVGGLVGLAVLVVMPRDPVKELRRAVEPALAEIRGVLDDVASALDHADVAEAGLALARARATASLDIQFADLVRQSRETALIAPTRWAATSAVDRYATAVPHVAVGRLPAELAHQTDRHAVLHALHAAEVASAALDHGPELPFSVVIAQIRAVAVDLLRALQVDRLEAAARVGDLPSELI
jgi:Fusaric acid resistance protein-like